MSIKLLVIVIKVFRQYARTYWLM